MTAIAIVVSLLAGFGLFAFGAGLGYVAGRRRAEAEVLAYAIAQTDEALAEQRRTFELESRTEH